MEPMLPQPIRPSVLAESSTPMKRFFSHLPAWVDRSAWGSWRASANISAMACSAVVIELLKEVFMTTIPAAVAAGMSTLSTPMPARPMTFMRLAAAITSLSALVAERSARPSYWSMILSRSSLARPVLTSASTPRAAKMSMAAGESLSAMRTRGGISNLGSEAPSPSWREGLIEAKGEDSRSGRLEDLVGDGGERPVEPGRQRVEVGRVDRPTAPDAQARGRVPVGGGVECDAFLLQKVGELLGKLRLALLGERHDAGVDDLEAHAGVGARLWILGQKVDPGRLLRPTADDGRVLVRAPVHGREAADGRRPLERVEIVLGAQQRGRVDGRTFEDIPRDLALGRQPEELRQAPGRRVGLQPLHRARREDQHPVRRLAAEHLLPGVGDHIELGPIEGLGEGGAGGVADDDALAVSRDEVGVRHPHAGRGAVPREDEVGVGTHLREVRQLAERRVQDLTILQLQLVTNVDHPVAREALPGGDLDRQRAEHRPHRHLDRAGVRGRHDADEEVVRHLEHLARAVDRLLEPALADLGAVRAAERRGLQVFQPPAWVLDGGSRGKLGTSRAHGRLGDVVHFNSHPCRWAAPRWEGVARRVPTPWPLKRQ